MRRELSVVCLPLLLAGMFVLTGCRGNDPAPTPPPSAPANVATHPAGGQVRITWTHPGVDVGFEVSFGTVASGDFDGNVMVGNVREAIVAGLVNGTEYQFRVRAQGAGLWSGFSETVTAIPVAALDPPAAPSNVQVVHGGQPNRLVVSWGAVPGALHYRVRYYRTNDPDSSTILEVDGSAEITVRNVTITDLDDNADYYVWVQSFNDYNDGTYSPKTMAQGRTLAGPDVPALSFEMEVATLGMLPVRWPNDPNAAWHDVRFARTDDDLEVDDATEWTMGVTRTGVDLGDGALEDDTEYTVWVRAGNELGVSQWAYATERTIETAPPPLAPNLFISNPGGTIPPGDIGASGGLSRTQLMVHWEPVPNAIRYEVAWSFNPNESLNAIPPSRRYFVYAPATQAPVFSTTNNIGAPYFIFVTSHGREPGGTAAISATPTAHGSVEGVPTIGIDAREMGRLSVRWSAVAGAIGYEFRWGETFNLAASINHAVEADLNRREIVFNLPDYTRRFFWVRAILPPADGDSENGHSHWGISHGRTRATPVHDFQTNDWAPPHTPDIAAMEALTDKISVTQGRSFNTTLGGEHLPFADRWGSHTISGNSLVRRNTVYLLTPEADPRVVLGLRLGTPHPEALALNPDLADQLVAQAGRPWFDQVILFNAGIRYRDCLNDTESVDPFRAGETRPFNVNGRPDNHLCNRSGLHLHFDNAIQYVLDNRDIYIRPLQEAGIRVLLSVLGDWGGITFNTFGEWPFEDVSPVRGPGRPGEHRGGPGAHPPDHFRDAAGNPHYPFHNAAKATFLIEIKNALRYYQLDGVCLDDEWAHSGTAEYMVVIPGGSTTWLYSQHPQLWNYYTGEHESESRRAAAWGRLGKKAAQFVVALRETIGPDFVIHLYEFGGFGSIPQANHLPRYVAHPFTGEIVSFVDSFSMSTSAVWPSHVAFSRIGAPNHNYAATAIDLFQTPRVRPTLIGIGGMGITGGVGRARQQLQGTWGWITYYGIVSRYLYVHGGRRDAPVGEPAVLKEAKGNFFDINQNAIGQGENNGPEVYLTVLSQVIHGADVIWNPAAYAALGVNHEHVHVPWLDRRVQPWVPRELFPDVP